MEATVYDKYEVVIGLEVHAQLMTKSKIFAADSTEFGAAPNTQVSPITLALPGVLPKLNKDVVDMAIKTGLALNCNITEVNHFARKNYFYADLPKGYQITQDKTPICTDGFMNIEVNGEKKRIGITRIHMEEDAGKNNHELDPFFSLVDLNRAGMPLAEIVSEPDLRSSDEAYAYLTELRKLVRYLQVCDGNMEEGSMRCDANISVRIKGVQTLGNRVEVKNMNSIRNVKRAIDGEVIRQIDIIEAGGTIEQQTRGFNPADSSTAPLRSKEDAHDYRYFPEPDLPPLIIKEERVQMVKATMPPLPHELFAKFTAEFGLSEYDAGVLTDEREIALYYVALTEKTKNYKAAANWIMGEVKSYLNQNASHIDNFALQPQQIVDIIELVDNGTVSSSGAKKLFDALVEKPTANPLELAKDLQLVQNSDGDQLKTWAETALAKFPAKVQEYKGGKKGILGLFMGEVMKLSGGQADPKAINKILQELLDA
ncbi:MAG TPA: Asp-tRNA(Asn)/Glu-tRNA(Gln) amidotransferase subunit GatB [Chitinophagales bacterium]|nr:Asp-tRNA(Asn)/Glu-tRNA(Gln) amidotransferase subunit GatB [Chitinophagales bacterium]